MIKISKIWKKLTYKQLKKKKFKGGEIIKTFGFQNSNLPLTVTTI